MRRNILSTCRSYNWWKHWDVATDHWTNKGNFEQNCVWEDDDRESLWLNFARILDEWSQGRIQVRIHLNYVDRKGTFLNAIDDRDLELRIREREPQDLNSALKQAVRLEALTKGVGEVNGRDNNRRNRSPRNDSLSRRVVELERRSAVNIRGQCSISPTISERTYWGTTGAEKGDARHEQGNGKTEQFDGKRGHSK